MGPPISIHVCIGNELVQKRQEKNVQLPLVVLYGSNSVSLYSTVYSSIKLTFFSCLFFCKLSLRLKTKCISLCQQTFMVLFQFYFLNSTFEYCGYDYKSVSVFAGFGLEALQGWEGHCSLCYPEALISSLLIALMLYITLTTPNLPSLWWSGDPASAQDQNWSVQKLVLFLCQILVKSSELLHNAVVQGGQARWSNQRRSKRIVVSPTFLSHIKLFYSIQLVCRFINWHVISEDLLMDNEKLAGNLKNPSCNNMCL